MSIQIFNKQPGDTIDVDISYFDYLPASDTIASSVVSFSDTGITLGTTVNNITEKKVKQWISGGTTGNRYKISIRMTSVEGRIKEVDFYVKVKEL